MKSKIFLSTLLAAFLVSPIHAFAQDTNNTASTATSMTAEQMQKDGEISAMLIALNENEIAAAKEALKKTSNPTVKKFATLMVKDHTKNLRAIQKVDRQIKVSPIDSESSKHLKEMGAKKLADLSVLEGATFDKAYIDAMVKGHTEAAQMVEETIPKVNNVELKNLLKASEATIHVHHEKAKAAQEKLNS